MAETEALEDCTSKLPQHIIHHILSFLQFRAQFRAEQAAATTSLLSKAWLSAWRTRPNLFFHYFPRYTDDQEIEIRRRSNIINSINTSLLRYQENKHGIDSLDLWLPSNWLYYVNRWLQIAIENSVKSLNIRFDGYPPILPKTIFEAKSLVKLVLSNLQLKPQVIKTIRCYNLRILELFRVDLDEVMFQRIKSSCPLIDELIVCSCAGLVNLKVTELEKLKKVCIDLKEIGCVEIEALSLECFYYGKTTLPGRHPRLQMLTCQNLKRLELDDVGITDEFFLDIAEKFPRLEVLKIRECHDLQRIKISSHSIKRINLKRLELDDVGITDEFFLDIAEKFPCLEVLKIGECHDLQRIKISSHSIKRINLEWNRGLEEAQIDVPNMDWFGYKESSLQRSIPLFNFTAPSGPWISRIDLLCWKWETSRFSNLKNLLTRLSQSEISLKINFNGTVPGLIAYEVMRNSARLPPPQVQKLLMCFNMVRNLDDAEVTLDAIFWTCRPKTIAQEWRMGLHSKDIQVAKIIFEMLIGNPKHTILQKTNSWKSYLKDAKVVILEDGKEVQLPLPLDWCRFLHILSTNDFWECFYYELEWETFDMAWEQKVSPKGREKYRRKNRTARVAKSLRDLML